MKDELIKDFMGVPLGIVTYEANGDVTVRDFNSRQILGFYRKSIDKTTDFYGRPLTQGNTAIALIYKHAQERK